MGRWGIFWSRFGRAISKAGRIPRAIRASVKAAKSAFQTTLVQGGGPDSLIPSPSVVPNSGLITSLATSSSKNGVPTHDIINKGQPPSLGPVLNGYSEDGPAIAGDELVESDPEIETEFEAETETEIGLEIHVQTQVETEYRSQNAITAVLDSAPVATEHLWQNQSFWAHLDSFLQSQNSRHTQRAYENDLVDFLSYLKATEKPMNVHTLIDYREVLRARVSPRTGTPLSHVSINRKIATIRSFLNWLVLNGVLANNPAKAVKSFRAGRESPTRDISNDLVKRMLELPARHKTGGRMHHAMLMILFHLGLRRAELVDLRTSDLFEQDGMRVIRVRGKGDKERILPILAEVAKSIDTYLEMARKDVKVDQPLFSPVKNNITKIKDKPLHPNAVAYVVKHYAKIAGVQYRVSPHSARATAVSNALDNHAPHRAVQHLAGWSSPLMVNRYDKRKQDLRNSAARFVDYGQDG